MPKSSDKDPKDPEVPSYKRVVSGQENTTNCYTYKVEMIIQMLAKDEQSARNTLDSQGGYITKRTVELINTTEIYKDK